MNPKISHLVGLVSGDGHIENSGRIVISTSNFEFAEIIQKITRDFSEHINTVFDKDSNVWRIKIKSKKLLKALKEANVSTGKKWDTVNLDFIKNLSLQNKVALVAGWLDAEGWYEIDKGSPRIRFKVKNKKVRDQMCDLLDQIEIKARKFNRKDGSYGFNIQGKDKVVKI